MMTKKNSSSETTTMKIYQLRHFSSPWGQMKIADIRSLEKREMFWLIIQRNSDNASCSHISDGSVYLVLPYYRSLLDNEPN